MKTLLKSAVVAAACIFSSNAFAGSELASSFTFDCTAKQMPSQQVFGRALGLTNFAETYDERLRMRSNLLHQCQAQKIKSIIVHVKTNRMLMVAKN